jgi:hypothetical protein
MKMVEEFVASSGTMLYDAEVAHGQLLERCSHSLDAVAIIGVLVI